MKTLFKLDLRSLALTRMLLGLLAFCDIFNRIGQINDFYSDKGILPRWLLHQQFQISWRTGLLDLIGDPSFVLIVAIVGLIAALAMIVGLRTRLSVFLTWLVIMSFQARFPEANHGGDNLMRLLLFISMFLPMNAFFSVDQLKRKTEIHEVEYFSVFTLAWFCQIFYMYFFTFYYKWEPSWFRDYDSVYYALSLDMFTRPMGKALLNYPFLMKFSSFYTMWLEGLGCFLLLIPYRRNFFVSLAIFFFVALHGGIWLTIVLGSFPPACIILWLALIPSPWWDKAQGIVSKLTPNFSTKAFLLKLAEKTCVSDIKLKMAKTTKAFGVFFIILTFAWNLEGAAIFPTFDLKSPFNEVVFLLQWNQQWNMFAPKPMRNDGWWIVEANLRDGRKWDILNDKAYSEERPDDLAETYPSTQWRKFMTNLYSNHNETYLLQFGKFLCRKWNTNEHNGQEVLNYQLIFMRDLTAPQGQAPNPVQKQVIWNHNCF